MQMYLMKEVNDIKVKMAKVETWLEANAKANKAEKEQLISIIQAQQERDKETSKLLLELKGDVNRVMGRTDSKDVNLTVNADNVDTIDQSITQNIDKGGEK